MTDDDREESWFIRHWRGELPLARAFWVDTVGVNWLIRILLFAVPAFADRLPLLAGPVLIAGFWSALTVVLVWQTTGVMRSAFRYETETGKVLNPILACMALLFLCANGVFGFVTLGVPQLSEALKIIRGDPQWPDPVITVLRGDREIEFSGIIKLHSAARLDEALNRHPAATVLHLDTLGGREREAVAMADVVRSHHLSTYVDALCASAGTVVFVAGKDRILLNGARIGFHSASIAGVPDPGTNRLQVNALTAVGADAAFCAHVVATLPDSAWYPDNDELMKQGIVTRISDGSGFSPGTRELARYDEKGLRKEMLDDPVLGAVAQREPEAFTRAVANAAKSLAGGADLKASLMDVSRLKIKTIRDAFPCISDDALDDYLDLELEILSRNMYLDPKATLQVVLFKAQETAVAHYPSATENRCIAALLASPRVPAPPVDAATAEEAHARFLECSKAAGRNFYGPRVPADRDAQAAMCAVMVNFLTAIRQLPPDRRHPLVRFFISQVLASRF
jgi:hypothetical protein